MQKEGAHVSGVCGGYQMLGSEVVDSEGIESAVERVPGLNLLPVRTIFGAVKTVTRSQARVVGTNGFWNELRGQTLAGYEIHMGQTESSRPVMQVFSREGATVSSPDGSCSQDGRVFGTYLHGLFDNDNFRRAWLQDLGAQSEPQSFSEYRLAAYDRLADTIAASIDVPMLDRLIGV